MTDNQTSSQQLSRTTITLHWLTAVGILGMLGFGLYISDLPRGQEKFDLIQIHKSFGAIMFFIVLTRLIWRLKEGWPPPASVLPVWEHRLARSIQWFFLLAPFVMIASGIAGSIVYTYPVNVFGLPFIPQLFTEKNEAVGDIFWAVHGVFAILIIIAVGLHVAGALRHHFIKRDGTLSRMLGKRISMGEAAPD